MPERSPESGESKRPVFDVVRRVIHQTGAFARDVVQEIKDMNAENRAQQEARRVRQQEREAFAQGPISQDQFDRLMNFFTDPLSAPYVPNMCMYEDARTLHRLPDMRAIDTNCALMRLRLMQGEGDLYEQVRRSLQRNIPLVAERAQEQFEARKAAGLQSALEDRQLTPNDYGEMYLALSGRQPEQMGATAQRQELDLLNACDALQHSSDATENGRIERIGLMASGLDHTYDEARASILARTRIDPDPTDITVTLHTMGVASKLEHVLHPMHRYALQEIRLRAEQAA